MMLPVFQQRHTVYLFMRAFTLGFCTLLHCLPYFLQRSEHIKIESFCAVFPFKAFNELHML